jgi:pimeloyl-ACP methyl ester carboxylesterase
MKTSFILINGGGIYVRHTAISPARNTILFLHGLGESSLSFREAFHASSLRDFNLIVPDLLGHGCSHDASGDVYSFESHIQYLHRLVDEFDIPRFFLAGHSMGGDIATHLTASNSNRVLGLINIEGNLTPSDVFISRQAVNADELGDFEKWFTEEFMDKKVLNDWAVQRDSAKRYFSSLWFCRPQAFLLNAREVCKRNSSTTDTSATETGLKFIQLRIPKVYCWGGKLNEQTQKLIEDEKITSWGFDDASHWPMIDKETEFYRLLAQFCMTS